MENDLISRSALYKEVESLNVYGTIDNENDALLRGSEVFNLIDSALTVELDGYVLYGTGLELVSTDWLDEQLGKDRQRGKWIIDGHHIRCNRCNEYICNTDSEGNKIPDNFCPNCGADMKQD